MKLPKNLKSLKMSLPIIKNSKDKEYDDCLFSDENVFLVKQIQALKKQNAATKIVKFNDKDDEPIFGMIIFHGKDESKQIIDAVEKIQHSWE